MTDLHNEAARRHVRAPDAAAVERALARHERRATMRRQLRNPDARRRGEVASKLAELEASDARADAADGFDLAEDLDVVRLDGAECCECSPCDCAAHPRADSTDDYQRGLEAARRKANPESHFLMKPIRPTIDPREFLILADQPEQRDAAIEGAVRRARGDGIGRRATELAFTHAHRLPLDREATPAELATYEAAVKETAQREDAYAASRAARAALPVERLDEAWTDPDGVEISEDEKKRRRAAAKASTLEAAERSSSAESHWNLEATLPFDMPKHERLRAHRDADEARERARRPHDGT